MSVSIFHILVRVLIFGTINIQYCVSLYEPNNIYTWTLYYVWVTNSLRRSVNVECFELSLHFFLKNMYMEGNFFTIMSCFCIAFNKPFDFFFHYKRFRLCQVFTFYIHLRRHKCISNITQKIILRCTFSDRWLEVFFH